MRWALPGFACAAAACAAAPAHAAFQRLGPSSAPVVTDGARYAAWDATFESTRVLDTRSGARFRVRRPSIVWDAPDGRLDVGAACRLASVHSGLLTWSCEVAFGPGDRDRVWDVHVYDVARRRFVPVRGLDRVRRRFPGTQRIAFGAAGRHWLGGSARPGGAFYVHRATGRVVTGRPTRARARAGWYADVDAPGLQRRTCQELRPRGEGSLLAPPLQLSWTRHRRNPLLFDVRIDRCGARPRLVRRCRCFSLALGSGRVGWTDNRHATVYRADTGRRSTLAVPGADPTGSHGVAVALTARHVFAWTGHRRDVHVARVP